MKGSERRRGSALMLVLISSVFLIILTGAAYQYFKNSVNTQIWTKDRIQAKLSAEAALNLATHMVVAGASLPQPGPPIPVLGTLTNHYDLPGNLGSAFVTVQASQGNEQEITANAFTLHCIAWPPGTAIDSYGLRATVMPTNLARFSVFMDDPSLAGYYADGYRFDGPFYANGPIRVYSESQTHENDVFFYSLSLTSDYYVYGFGDTHVSVPEYGKLQMRPIERLSMGAPYFELGVDPIPFGPTELNWQGIRSAAISGGLYLDENDVPDRARLALKGDTLSIQIDTLNPPVSYYLGGMDNPVVWINNGTGNSFYLRGNQFQGLNMPLTIGAEGTFLMSGPLYYDNPDPQDPNNECLLGLLTPYGDMLIAEQVDSLANVGWWNTSFMVQTEEEFTYSAVLVALDGVLEAENYLVPDPQVEFKIIGGYMVQNEGFTGTGGPKPKGYTIGVYFDPRLLTMHPPFFPTTANWKTIMWEEVPGMWPADVQNGYLYY